MEESNDARIPVVDLNTPGASSDLLDAACKHGFVYIKHDQLDLTPQEVDEMFAISKTFFEADPEVKAECTINSKAAGSNRGWLSLHTEKLDPAKHKKGDFKEAFNIGEYVDGKAPQPMPQPIKPFEAQIGVFQSKCIALCDRIMKQLAEGLQIPESEGGNKWFESRHDRKLGNNSSVLRLLYYPSLPPEVQVDASEDIRAGAHSDYGSVTLLFRLPGQPGLEVLTPSGQWAAVPVNPDPSSGSQVLPILVNIGDLLSFWTNGMLKSTVHRVVFPASNAGGAASARDRYSIAYFSHPNDDAELVEIPSEMVKRHAAAANGHAVSAVRTLTAKDHLNERLAATYKITA